MAVTETAQISADLERVHEQAVVQQGTEVLQPDEVRRDLVAGV